MISDRLKIITELIDKNLDLADIGTDHGIIPVELLKDNFNKNIIATDINPKPLSRAKEYLDRSNFSGKVDLRVGNGLSPIEKGEVDQIVIAGMGGELIAKILENDLDKAKEAKQLILQPMSRAKVLREFLVNNGFNIAKDLVIEDNQSKRKHFFHILVADTNEGKVYKPEEILFGPLDTENIVSYKHYIEHKISEYQKRIKSMEKSDNSKTNRRRLEYERRFQFLLEYYESFKNS